MKLKIINFIIIVIFLILTGCNRINVMLPDKQVIKEWSIGIYVGETPFNFKPAEGINNPVLTAKDVTDVPAKFIADPFMIYENNLWYMFFEVYNTKTSQPDIALAISKDGFHWIYQQIVLDEPFVLSYPYVFKWQNEYYMLPESCQDKSIRLYKAIDFPTKWALVIKLFNVAYVGSSIFYYENKWWIYTFGPNLVLRLFYSENLTGPYTEHPKSPLIIDDNNISRPGGRVIVYNGKVIRYTQDDIPTYGNQVRAFEVDLLTLTEYKEHEVSTVIIASGSGWNKDKMHHIDPHQLSENKWIACVDGYQNP